MNTHPRQSASTRHNLSDTTSKYATKQMKHAHVRSAMYQVVKLKCATHACRRCEPRHTHGTYPCKRSSSTAVNFDRRPFKRVRTQCPVVRPHHITSITWPRENRPFSRLSPQMPCGSSYVARACERRRCCTSQKLNPFDSI